MILGQQLSSAIMRPKNGPAPAQRDKPSPFEPSSPQPGDAPPPRGDTTPGQPNPLLPSSQRGTPAQDSFANQGPWAKLAFTGNEYQKNQPTPAGPNYGQAIAAQPGLFSAPQRPITGLQPERLERDFAPTGQPQQNAAPGGQTPFAPAPQSPAFRGANVVRFTGNPLQMNRTDISLTDNLAGTRQPGRFPMMPSKQRQIGVNTTQGAAPMPTSYPVPRLAKPYSTRGFLP